MSLNQKVSAAIQTMDMAPGGILKQMGFPNLAATDQLETANWTYRDAVRQKLTLLSDIQNQTTLFQNGKSQGVVRNLAGNLTSDLSFVHDVITCDADFTFDPAVTVENTPYFGPMLEACINRVLMATRMTMQVSQKNYVDEQIGPWTNFQLPPFAPVLIGQASAAPVTLESASYQQRVRVHFPLDPEIVWPANSNVQIVVETNIKNYWQQILSGTDEVADFTAPPFNFPVAYTLQFSFPGLQIRRVK